MKKTISSLILLFFVFEFAVAQHPWSVGISFQPARYILYNKTEWTAPDTLFGVVHPGAFEMTGWAAGISAAHRFSKHIALETELNWSKQEQKFAWDRFTDFPMRIETKLNYFKLPVLFKYIIPFTNSTFYYKAGFQISYLSSYEEVLTIPEFITPSYQKIYKNARYWSDLDNKFFECDWIYNRFQFGLVGEIGFEQFILNKKMSFNIGLRYEYDLSNADNLGAREYSTSPQTPDFPVFYYAFSVWQLFRTKNFGDDSFYYAPTQDRKKSHNIRLALDIGFKYHFGKKTYRVKKVNASW